MGDSHQEGCSSSAFDLSQFLTELKCCICLSLFEDPKQLQCGHICCAACLQSLVDMANEPGVVGILFGGKSPYKTIACPQCREENRVPADNKFTTAFVVKNLVSHVKEAEKLSDKAEQLEMGKCSSCAKTLPCKELFYCLDCNDFKENESDEELYSTFIMTKLIFCPLCACKLHGQHKKVAANEAVQAIKADESNKRLETIFQKSTGLQGQKSTLEKEVKAMDGKQASASGNGVVGDPHKLAKADEYRLRGNEAYGRYIFEKAINCYTLSIRECPSSVCLSNRAQCNLKLGRFSVAYVDANEALRLDPNNEKAKMRRDKALECMGMARAMEGRKEPQKEEQMPKERVKVKAKRGGKAALWPTNLVISIIHLMNEDYPDEGIMTGGIVPQNVICVECSQEGPLTYKEHSVPLRQLDLYLNDKRVQGPVPQAIFKFVKFDEQMVQMFRRIKRERFTKVDTHGVRHKGNQWLNCDFSQLSTASFRFLFDSYLFGSINRTCMADCAGLPAGLDFNSLFKFQAFRDAVEVKFDIGFKNGPDSPGFNLHLDKDVLIDYLHSPGFRSLNISDGQLHGGFDAFLHRLINRYMHDNEKRFYELSVMVFHVSDKIRKWMDLSKPIIIKHAENDDQLILKWYKPETRVPLRGLYSIDNLFELKASRYRNQEDMDVSRLYNSKTPGYITT